MKEKVNFMMSYKEKWAEDSPYDDDDGCDETESNGDRSEGDESAQTVTQAQSRSTVASDAANAARLLKSQMSATICSGDKWLVYGDGVYRAMEDPDTLSGLARGCLDASHQTDAIITQVLKTVRRLCYLEDGQELRSFYTKNKAGELLLCCRNGVLRVPSEGEPELLPHDPQYFFTRQLAAAYDPKSDCSVFKRVLKESLPEKADRELLRVMFGYTLYPSSQHAVMLFAYGDTGTGKSTLFDDGLATVLGRSLVTREEMASLCNPKSYALPDVCAAALNLGSEAQASELSESSQWKKLVEGSPITVRPIYGKPHTANGYTTKFICLGNHLPQFHAGTDAELRRTRFLRFCVAHSKTDVTVGEQVKAEADGIFSQFMVSNLQWLLRGNSIPFGSDASVKLRVSWAVNNDHYASFIAECLEVGTDFEELKDDLYKAFQQFCESNDIDESRTKRSSFFRRMSEKVPGWNPYRPRSGIGRRQMVKGARLRSAVVDGRELEGV